MVSGGVTSVTIILIVFFLFKEGIGLFGSPTVEQGYVVAVNRENTVRNLSPVQLKEIFDSEVTNWSQYGGADEPIVVFRIDDIDRYETATGETFYCFELETRFDDDIEVYISIDGEILPGRPSLGTSGGGAAVNSDIEAFIAERYPGATIIEKDNDDGYIEVEILHDGLEKEVVFNGRNEWIRTEWEIHRNQLPTEVIEVIEKAGYSSRHIDDDIDVIETDAGLKYEVEIEDGHTDIKLIITNGTITDILRD